MEGRAMKGKGEGREGRVRRIPPGPNLPLHHWLNNACNVTKLCESYVEF